VLNGGIIATLLDCHGICTAWAEAQRRQPDEDIWYVTGQLNVRYLQPAPIAERVEVKAEIQSVSDKKTKLMCRLYSRSHLCAEAEVLAIRVNPAWNQSL